MKAQKEVMDMSTLENTITMLEALPEADLRKVSVFIKKFFLTPAKSDDAARVASYNPYQPLTGEELFNSLEESRKRAEEGHVLDAHQVAANVREKYGF